MSFDDLPADWPERPLTDPTLVADVLDLVVTERSRDAGALYLLLCDRDDRLLVPVAIDDIDRDAPKAERVRVLSGLLSHLEEPGSLLVAIARRGGLSVTADDELWARSVLSTLGGWRLLGIHLVTPHGSRPLPRVPAA
jgi:hypothetical protein